MTKGLLSPMAENKPSHFEPVPGRQNCRPGGARQQQSPCPTTSPQSPRPSWRRAGAGPVVQGQHGHWKGPGGPGLRATAGHRSAALPGAQLVQVQGLHVSGPPAGQHAARPLHCGGQGRGPVPAQVCTTCRWAALPRSNTSSRRGRRRSGRTQISEKRGHREGQPWGHAIILFCNS